ncbi:Universal stress protein UspA [Caenispirillum salinarum AK4]|uniref:Universal stress protein UspA n=1 Tax=Caenispirillum salinarum AK4 TaxID=1238182 RepID=K9GS05_9PROT|nr:universal stress protein [Caenispirillum salinarum]EKV27539.1 Universal stress protein UspA [Caenispirillum salinarum AK4]
MQIAQWAALGGGRFFPSREAPPPSAPEADPVDGRTTLASKPQGRRAFLVVVDDSPEMTAAARFAARRAARSGGRVALLSVVEPVDGGHWMFVGNLMAEEAREDAERRLQQVAATVHACSGERPELIVREGSLKEQLFKLIEEDDEISILVLGVAANGEGPGPLVQSLTGKNAGKLRIPVTIVPGDLSDAELEALT